MKRWIAAGALFLLLFTIPYVAAALGVIEGVHSLAWLTLFFAFVTASLKIILAPRISGEFRIDRHGNDLCILAVAGCLSLFSVQVSQKTDILPGARRILADMGFAEISGDPVMQNVVAVSVFGILAVFAFFGTAVAIDHVRKAEAVGRKAHLLTGFSYLAGLTCATLYGLSMAVK